MRLPRYGEYKDSGHDWLGRVPAHWPIKRLRYVAELNPSKSELAGLDRSTEVSFLPMEAIGDDGSISLEKTRPISEVETGYTYFRDGDVTLAKITPCFENGKGALMQGLQAGIGFGTTELIVARPRPLEVLGPLLNWIFRSPNFRAQGEAGMYGAGGQKRVPDDFVRDFAWAFPPLAEQAAIGLFLDRETAKIDALIAEQKKLIVLLAEKRQATISHAVTKGLNAMAPMKASGVAWLGEVPAHWQAESLKTLFRQTKRQGHVEKQVLSVYRDYGVINKDSRSDNFNKTPEDLSLYQLVLPNDLVVNKMKGWQGSLGVSSLEGITSPDYMVFSPLHQHSPDFLHLLLRSASMVSVYRSISNGIRPAQWRLEPEEFLALKLPLPPATEQRGIVAFLNRELTKLDELVRESERSIGVLTERRGALISAVVTGQLDVRNA